MSIIHTTVSDGQYKTLAADCPSFDPAGFDTMVREVLFRGSPAQMKAAFPVGSLLTGYNHMFCCGPQGNPQSLPSIGASPFLKFQVLWKGFLDLASRPDSLSHTMTTRETMLPIVNEKANGTKFTTYAAAAMCPGNNEVNSKTKDYWKVRVLDRISGAKLQGVAYAAKGQLPAIPQNPSLNPPSRLGSINYSTLVDPVINYPVGWTLMTYEIDSQFAMTNGTLCFWTAHYEYRHEYNPG